MCWPEHMWRTGLGRSPSRARRAAVSDVQRRSLGSAGEHRLRHAHPTVQGLERPDVQVLARVARGHHRELLGREVELRDAAGPQQRHQAEWLDRGAQVDQPVRVAQDVEHPSGRVHLHDVAALDRLHHAIAHLAREHGRHRPACGASGWSGAGGSAGGPGSHGGEHSAPRRATAWQAARPPVAARPPGLSPR